MDLAKQLKSILFKFKKSDYPVLLEKWQPLKSGLSNVNVLKIGKREFTEVVAKKLKREISPALVASLDLLHLQLHNKKLWKVYHVHKIPGKNPKDISSADQFLKYLQKLITSYLDADVHLCAVHNIFWIRISVTKQALDSVTPPSVCYVVHVPQTDYLVVTGLKLSHREFLVQSFMMLLHGHRVTDMSLSGYHLRSLFQLIYKKHASSEDQDSVCKIRTTEEEELPANVFNEFHGQKRCRREFVLENFGPNKLPRLERLDYKLETQFRGLTYAPAMSKVDKIFRCRVRFEGSSVLEGLRNLAEAGLAELPMKNTLSRVHTMATNVILIKKNTNTANR